MMNRKIILTLSCLLVIGLLWLLTKESNLSRNGSQIGESKSPKKQLDTAIHHLEQSQSKKENRGERNEFKLPIVAKSELREEYKLDLEKDNFFDKQSPFKFFGSGGVGKLLGKDGSLLLQSNEQQAIFSIRVNPSLSNVVALGGSSPNHAFSKNGKLLAVLPKAPAQGQINFGSWHWVSDDVLVGDSGDLIPHKHDPEKHGAEGICEGCYAPLTSNTRLYTFNVKTKEMGEVALPEQLQGKRFTILRAVYDGTLEIADEEESYMGWVKINPEE
ncbi:MAG: hypothetical protein ABF334_09840 [Akkermansiaceae bacterium]